MIRILFILCLLTTLSCAPKGSTESHSPTTTEVLGDDSLLTLIQKQTFKYFWDGAEPHSGLAPERIHIDGIYPQNDKEVITMGGSGFGLMGMVVAMERGFISKEEGEKRLSHIMDYLGKIERFHGAWAHWYNGDTGSAKPFSKNDNGGDLVETAFLVQGLLTVREYFKDGSENQKLIASKADSLWKEVDWNHYTNGTNKLYWHWSPTLKFEMDHPILGYDECLITYVLAASSPTFPIDAKVYHEGWARSGAIKSTATKFGIPLGIKHNALADEIGPLFWAHYSYLGLNPKGLTDKYANYWDVVVNHTKINIAYADENPHKFKGYGSDKGWGLTASYSLGSYNAHHPNNDKSVISPTAALSSIAYTPKESISFARYLYTNLGDKVWGKYGFYDAYSETENWFPQAYLAIDEGPIVVMIENYKSGLIWDLFMNAPEIQKGLKKLGFNSPYIK